MTQSSYPAAARWLLLCVVALGLVGMHHVTAESGHGGMHEVASVSLEAPCCQESPSDIPAPAHDALHLCLAVLAAAFLLIVTWLLVRSGRLTVAWKSSPGSGSPSGRDPPRWRTVPERLASLCVMRV